jgi:hypothetical protein
MIRGSINPVMLCVSGDSILLAVYNTAVFQNSAFATTLLQVYDRCIPIHLAAIPIPPKTNDLFYISFLLVFYTIVTYPSAVLGTAGHNPRHNFTCPKQTTGSMLTDTSYQPRRLQFHRHVVQDRKIAPATRANTPRLARYNN